MGENNVSQSTQEPAVTAEPRVLEPEIVNSAPAATGSASTGSKNSYVEVAKKIGKGFFSVLKNIVIICIKSVKSFVSFFMALDLKSKVTFVVIMLVFGLVFFLVGYKTGENNIKNDVEDILNVSFDKLGKD